jgi:hypothetical protein
MLAGFSEYFLIFATFLLIKLLNSLFNGCMKMDHIFMVVLFYFIVGKIISGPDFCVNAEEGSMPNFETIKGMIQLEFQLNALWFIKLSTI